MFCSSCGKELEEGDKFCSYCGAKVEDTESADNAPSTEDVASQEQEEKVTELAQEENKNTQEQTEEINKPQPEQESKFKSHLDKKAISTMVGAGIIVIIILTIIIGKIIDGNKSKVYIGGQVADSNNNKANASSYSLNIYSADGNTSAVIQNAEVTIYAGDDNQVLSIESETKSKPLKLEDGEYKIVVSAEGYFEYTANVSLVKGSETDIYLTPKPEAGTIIYRADWNGEQDLDMCVFNATDSAHISIGSKADTLGTHISSDNSSDKGYELLYLPQADTDDVRTIYVVDSLASQNGTDSTMENDGVRITAYDSDGEIYSIEADTSKVEPIWNVGYVFNGKAYPDTVGYMADCESSNKWSQYLKVGQEYRISEKMEALNALGDLAIPSFNSQIENFFPSQRSEDKSWDMTVFYALEAEYESPGYYSKNLCLLKKLQVRNEVNGNIVDYDIYINPETNLPNKIVSIEYISTGIEVYEYYYDNNGKVNFIFHYYSDNYVSTYATVGKAGERFLFCDDSLVTWRVVQAGNKVDNYCYGSAEKQRLIEGTYNNKAVWEYSTLNDETKSIFDACEKIMLNYAYNVYYMAVSTEPVGRVIGVLYKGNYEPCSNVEIEIYDSSFEKLLYTTKTNDSGEYCIYVPVEQYTYNLKVKGSTEDNSYNIYNVHISNNDIVSYVDAGFYFENETQDQEVELYIGNAFEGYGSNIEDADVNVRRGINNRTGEIVLSSKTDSLGYVKMFLRPGVYTIEACKIGYESIFYTIVASPYYSNKYQYYTPPTLTDGEYAIVLSWGEYPHDLDSHLFTNGEGTSTHVWYHERYDSLNSYLDVDDTESYGPETITITKFNQNSYYKYCVIDYSNSSRGYYHSTDMSYSNATVSVYSGGGHVATYHVPVNKEGIVWEVFEIRNGTLTPIQRYYDNLDSQSWWMN